MLEAPYRAFMMPDAREGASVHCWWCYYIGCYPSVGMTWDVVGETPSHVTCAAVFGQARSGIYECVALRMFSAAVEWKLM